MQLNLASGFSNKKDLSDHRKSRKISKSARLIAGRASEGCFVLLEVGSTKEPLRIQIDQRYMI